MDKPAATQLLAEVFSADPLFAHLFQPDTGLRKMRLVMRFLLEMALRHGEVVTQSGDALLAYYAPGRFPVSLWRLLPLFIRLIPGFIGAGLPVRRIWRSLSLLGYLEKKHPAQPHWYISMIVVSDRARGQGLGSKLIAPLLAEADARGEMVYLESSNPQNHNFYRRHGFEIAEEYRHSAEMPAVWRLQRNPLTKSKNGADLYPHA
ncbi:MAG: GNAT family N-acetyltransferase [Turneriella sp.]|nr:GNAT family N-acetyltransferase [Turneriella sp.]